MGSDDSKEKEISDAEAERQLLEQSQAGGGFTRTSFTKESIAGAPAAAPGGDGFVKESMGKAPPKLINKPLPEAEKAKPKKAREAVSPLMTALNKLKAEEEKKKT